MSVLIHSYYGKFKSSSSLKSCLFILLSATVSYVVMGFVYPELLFRHELSFLWQNDGGILKESLFTFVSNALHGGVQLWNRYDEMNYAYLYLSHGIQTLVNILTGWTYLLLSPFFAEPGKALHIFYCSVFHFFLILIRTAGGYLLLRKFRCHPLVIFVSLLILNTLLTSHMYVGYTPSNLYSYFLLLAYFLLRFFDRFHLKDFLCSLLVMAMACANSLLLALGYFYQVVHFFMVGCFVFNFGQFKATMSKFKQGFTQSNLWRVLGVLSVCILLTLPCLYLARSLKKDFYIPNSGLGDTKGRMKMGLNPLEYFKPAGKSFANPWDWPVKAVDFEHNDWAGSWLFLGASVLWFSLIGLVFSKHREKHIFLWSAIGILSVNFPQDPHSFFSLGHWLNALTNPFRFLLRSFHMSSLLMPLLFFPLVAFGLQALKELLSQNSESTYADRVPVAMVTVMAIVVAFSFLLPFTAKVHTILSGIIFLAILVFIHHRPLITAQKPFLKILNTNLILVFLIISTVAVDLKALCIYMHQEYYQGRTLTPMHYVGLDDPDPVLLEYQNPFLLPFREYYSFSKKDVKPFAIFQIGNLFYQEHSAKGLVAYGLLIGCPGLFFQYTPLERYTRTVMIYNPFHWSYRNIYDDPEIEEYLARDKRFLYLADYAIDAEHGSLGEILNRNLDRKVILVEGQGGERWVKHLQNLADLSQNMLKGPEEEPVYRSWEFPFSPSRVRQQGDFKKYIFDLPKDFPSYLSTTIFTDDRLSWQLKIGDHELLPVQGSLNPWTFDVQNVRQGKLAILLPKDFNTSGITAMLKVKLPEGISDIWRNAYDDFGFNYRAPRDGWLVVHYPFDSKWSLSVDGKPSPIAKVNGYFIGTPLSKGEHRILLRYWPGTPLRIMIFISIILTVLVFFGLIIKGIRWENDLLREAIIRR